MLSNSMQSDISLPTMRNLSTVFDATHTAGKRKSYVFYSLTYYALTFFILLSLSPILKEDELVPVSPYTLSANASEYSRDVEMDVSSNSSMLSSPNLSPMIRREVMNSEIGSYDETVQQTQMAKSNAIKLHKLAIKNSSEKHLHEHSPVSSTISSPTEVKSNDRCVILVCKIFSS
jgi:hypothetical protein